MPDRPNNFNLTQAEARLIEANAPLIRYIQSRIGSFVFASGLDMTGLKRWQEEVSEAERLCAISKSEESPEPSEQDLNVLYPSHGTDGKPDPDLVALAEKQYNLDPLDG